MSGTTATHKSPSTHSLLLVTDKNVISRAITKDALAIDAIVEENFPPEAMTSAHAFLRCLH